MFCVCDIIMRCTYIHHVFIQTNNGRTYSRGTRTCYQNNPALPLSKIKKWKGAEIIANVQQLVEKCGITKRKPNKEQEANLAWVESKSENELFYLKYKDGEEAKTAIQQIIEERQARFRE